ncbi:hypothetical protein DPMN_138961 [Dreissena polymorpha]|uniref:Uncharacterized protein n=1 Tax=Dreissena polymorpha TaxID=45954 RepID=A0A9D4G5G2_DREPO|nr:hypothetical protein DPMN_138961 [Dreissena polymorpha]
MDTEALDRPGSPGTNRDNPWPFERRQSSKDHHPDDNTASTRTKPGSNTAPTRIVPDSHCRATDLHIIYMD